MDSGKQREGFASRLGFILVSAGCAVGIGNVWRFPTVTGQNGGGVFVLFYLLFLVLMGVPVLTMELAVGRAGHNSAVKAYKALEPKGTKWHLHGWVCMIGCALLMMYYTTVAGWMLDYFFKFLTGRFTGLTPDASAQVFSDALATWARLFPMFRSSISSSTTPTTTPSWIPSFLPVKVPTSSANLPLLP